MQIYQQYTCPKCGHKGTSLAIDNELPCCMCGAILKVILALNPGPERKILRIEAVGELKKQGRPNEKTVDNGDVPEGQTCVDKA